MAATYEVNKFTGAVAIPQNAQNNQQVAVRQNDQQQLSKYDGPPRTSDLLAPTMQLSGHQGEILSAKFHPDGNVIASTGNERNIYLWNVFGECENFYIYKVAHDATILDLKFNTDGSAIFTASVDKTVGMFDTETGERVKRMKGHKGIVNACSVSRRGDQLVASASDDCTVKIWDTRRRHAVKTLQLNYQVTAVCFDDTAQNIVTAGIDNDVRLWSINSDKAPIAMYGHKDTITDLCLSHNGGHALSNSMDGTLRMWDVRPYSPGERCKNVYFGHKHGFEKNLLKCSWSTDDSLIACGSADRLVNVWNVHNRQLVYKLPGHNGSVNDVQFHPKQPIVMSCSSDKEIFLGELQVQ